MRLAVVVQQLRARVPGGTGRYTGNLVNALAQACPKDSSVVGWATRGPELGLDVSVRGWPVPPLALPRLWERGVGPRPAADVVHAPTLLMPPTGSYRNVVTIHDLVPWTHPETLTPRGVRFHQRMGRRAARVADLITTPTEAVAAAVRVTLEPRCDVVAIPPGVPPLPAPSVASTPPNAVSPYALFVGTAEPRKGLDVLLTALADPRLRHLNLVCVGPAGWGGVSASDLADRVAVTSRVRIAGVVTDQALVDLYSEAALLVMPSRAEGFGLPVVEAMSLGVPVVTSDDPALTEVAGGAAAVAMIGDPGSLAAAMLEVLDDAELRARMTEAGRVRAGEFSWAASADRLWAAYEGLV